MTLKLNKVYVDRRGREWLVTGLNGPELYPVAASRWDDKTYYTRLFQRDGRYFKDEDSMMDLIAESPARPQMT